MVTGNLLDHLGPHTRVATAVLPVLLALVSRMIFGKNRATGWLLTCTTLWFAVNVWMAPYSAAMRQDIRNLTVFLP